MKELKTTYRTTFALDEVARKRIKRLSKKWQVSQAEVIRRSLEKAEAIENQKLRDPLEMLEKLSLQGGLLAQERAASYLAENQEHRKDWRNGDG